VAIRLHNPGGMRPILLFLVVAGCIPSGPGEINVPIDSFSNLYMTATEQSLEIVVGNRLSFSQSSPCPLVDANLTARLGDVPVPLITRGGKTGDEPGDDVSDNVCGTVTLRLDGPPPKGPAVLQISDSKTTVACNIPDLKAPRALMQMPESDPWQWRSGQTVSVQWSPSGDLSRWSLLMTELTPVVVDGMRLDGTEINNTTIEGDLMHFTVPSVAPGSYELSLDPWGYVSCYPNASLSISTLTGFAAHHAVTILP
jgi:hypothetical protein